MKLVPVTLSSIALAIACCLPMAHGTDRAAALAAGCHPGNPLAGVTAPARFQVLNTCASVTGTIRASTREPDGAYQVDVALDSTFRALLSAGNTSRLHGWLLLEISQFAAALGLRPPPVGAHVQVVGPLVLNRNHGWTEINPVWVLHTTSAPVAQPPAQTGGSSGGSGSAGGSGTAREVLFVTVAVTPKVMPRAYNNAVATARTLPGASCTASLQYDHNANPLAALFSAVGRTADANGTVVWQWGLDWQITGGGLVTVTCSKDGHSAQGSARFTIR